MKLKTLFIYAVSFILLTITVPTTAPIVTCQTSLKSSENLDITPYAEETKWYYRVVDGEWQKRLWSLTHGEWITDWMPL